MEFKRFATRFLVFAIIFGSIYLILDIYFNLTLVYIVGGALATVLEFFNITTDGPQVVGLWSVLLPASIIGFYKVRNSIFKYLLLAFTGFLLGFADLPFSALFQYHNTWLLVAIKTLTLALVAALGIPCRKGFFTA